MQEFDSGKLNEDDLDHRLKWQGFFHRRKITYGRFMMRTKLPNGILSSAQVGVEQLSPAAALRRSNVRSN